MLDEWFLLLKCIKNNHMYGQHAYMCYNYFNAYSWRRKREQNSILLHQENQVKMFSRWVDILTVDICVTNEIKYLPLLIQSYTYPAILSPDKRILVGIVSCVTCHQFVVHCRG